MLQQSAVAKFSLDLHSKQKKASQKHFCRLFLLQTQLSQNFSPPLIGMQSHSIRLAAVSEEIRSQNLQHAIL